MKHDACTHPRTPAGRAACRRSGNQPAQVAVKTTTANHPGSGGPTVERRPPARSGTLADRSAINAARTHGYCPDRFIQAMIKAEQMGLGLAFDLTGNPGAPYTVRLATELGVVTLVWSDEQEVGGVVWWRPTTTSVSRRIGTVEQGIGYLLGER